MKFLIFINFFVALIITFALTPLAIKIAPKIGALDIPKDDRRMHTKSMPRFGGIAIYLGSMASIILLLPGTADRRMTGIAIGATLILIMGIIDDIWGLSARVKLVGQIACSSILFAYSIRISFVSVPFGDGMIIRFPWFISLVVTLLWLVGITNTINLIDGLDGLAAGISGIATITLAYIAYIHGRYEICMAFMALAGSCLGFLPWNFHPARIFMGDGGALYLGFMIAAISVMSPMKSATMVATILPILVLALPILDTALAILRRWKNGRPIMEADKGHLHHRIMGVGMGQKRTVLTLYSISGVMGVAAILISRDLFLDALALVVIAFTLIYVFMKDRGFGKPFKERIPDSEDPTQPQAQAQAQKAEEAAERDELGQAEEAVEKEKLGQAEETKEAAERDELGQAEEAVQKDKLGQAEG